jgi:ferredoxin-NADP reductase
MNLEVLAVSDACPGVRTLRLGRPDGGPLPPYTPGSHLVIGPNAYSLTGSGVISGEYRVSVRSAWMHRLIPGDIVEVTGPRCMFPPVLSAKKHLLVAGGIGITPILSHVRAALLWDRPFTLVYGYRPGFAAHLEELRELCGDRLQTCSVRERLPRLLGSQPLGTHLYVCGPAPMISFVEEQAYAWGWPRDRVHSERFSADLDPGRPFTVRLARSGTVVQVPSGTSMLEAIRRSGVALPNLCRQGVCGQCRTALLSGRAEHRDLYLTPEERDGSVMPCVSRALDDELEVDL